MGRPFGNRDQNMGECRSYDPRIRPWFIGASTGPKDIVLVVDKSSSMDDLVGDTKVSKWNVTKRAVYDILDTFTFADFVNVVTFSDSAQPLWTKSGLVRGSARHLEILRNALDDEFPRGQTNFTAAFDTAFSLLTNDCSKKPESCSNCQKIILFLTDGVDTSSGDGDGIKVSKMMAAIDTMQWQLQNKTRQRAVVFTFSMTEEANDSVPRHIACANDGAWSLIDPETNTLDALNSYFLYIAAGREERSPIWIEPYEDAGGMGIITTVAMPFFVGYPFIESRLFLGVVGHDVKLEEFEEHGVTLQRVRDQLITRSSTCSIAINSICDLQVFRNAHDTRSICPDRFPEAAHDRGKKRTLDRSAVKCYQFKGGFYKRFYEELPWEEAERQCRRGRGQLVTIRNPRQLAFVASLASPDGTWIGARLLTEEDFVWSHRSNRTLSKHSSFWGGGEPSLFEANEEQCVAIDSRGIIGNLAVHRCSKPLSYICKYTTNSSCGAESVSKPEGGFFTVPQLPQCLASKQAREEISPVDHTSNLTRNDVICKIKPHMKATYASSRCCDLSSAAALPRLGLISLFTFTFMIVFILSFNLL